MTRTDFTIRHEGTRVLLVVNGRTIADIPWDKADEIGLAIRAQARKAEEIAKRERIIFDHAILIRVGAPLSLTQHPLLLKEAVKTAAWDSSLRRYLPGGIRSRETFGTPAIIRHDPQE